MNKDDNNIEDEIEKIEDEYNTILKNEERDLEKSILCYKNFCEVYKSYNVIFSQISFNYVVNQNDEYLHYLRELIVDYSKMYYRSVFENRIVEILNLIKCINTENDLKEEYMLVEEELDKISFDFTIPWLLYTSMIDYYIAIKDTKSIYRVYMKMELLESRKDKLLPKTKIIIMNSYIRILYSLGYSNDGILLYKNYKNEINKVDEIDKCEVYYNVGKCYINMKKYNKSIKLFNYCCNVYYKLNMKYYEINYFLKTYCEYRKNLFYYHKMNDIIEFNKIYYIIYDKYKTSNIIMEILNELMFEILRVYVMIEFTMKHTVNLNEYSSLLCCRMNDLKRCLRILIVNNEINGYINDITNYWKKF